MQNRLWATTAIVVAAAVAGTTGVAVWKATQGHQVQVAPAYPGQPAVTGLAAATGTEPVDEPALAARLDQLAANPDLGQLVGEVVDATSGQVLWQKDAAQPVRPASTTKVLTAAAALLTQAPDSVLTTEVVAGGDGSIVLRGGGDVMVSAEMIADLASQVQAAGLAPTAVLVDTSAWAGEEFSPEWHREDIEAGFIAPMQPVMLMGARIGGDSGDLPRSATPALDVAHALADALGVAAFGFGPAPADAEPVARVESAPLLQRLRRMMLTSDNIMAEAEGRAVARAVGVEASQEAAARATLDTLAGHGFDTTGVELKDNSGLSDNDLIPPQLLTSILQRAASEPQLRPLLQVLPVAGATGSLATRFEGQPGRGWARAKTGTLTTTSALAGTITSATGHVYAYAFISNESSVLPARKALDELVSGLRG
ncbi:D-alanyl-D-alanine carboxypeptidase/D-alanyl-D-alanine-endopeptidase [Corynebacterium sp. 13CS0277]|uniref:D-alanyl-D-alanine carboxypeptidase/D-alanyl-D-alanine endopeptidase n=1 Tax=Corynebacterium sp. 13CS0277 TaxID=2071994 RepID=UPI000D042111|nr:D-alanyl-D-alanine carboxypeptidase/D-alanyl-D-alanine-endopeptidase [Corynebacterium sp. 13CS0277]PRQ11544.1 D-alanyl-D-alanine carboxypeptidase/D-alanyl-D-alanine-endopeptidase [Corynebacterium sp. 13CS0277]